MMLAKSLPINPPDAAIPGGSLLSITTDLAVGVETAFASCGASLKKSGGATVAFPHTTNPTLPYR
jgi:hypothetical protein